MIVLEGGLVDPAPLEVFLLETHPVHSWGFMVPEKVDSMPHNLKITLVFYNGEHVFLMNRVLTVVACAYSHSEVPFIFVGIVPRGGVGPDNSCLGADE